MRNFFGLETTDDERYQGFWKKLLKLFGSMVLWAIAVVCALILYWSAKTIITSGLVKHPSEALASSAGVLAAIALAVCTVVFIFPCFTKHRVSLPRADETDEKEEL
jgi:uncharacterized membrane-anchored protein